MERLRLPTGLWWYLFNLVSDASAVLCGWLHVWFAYYLFRTFAATSEAVRTGRLTEDHLTISSAVDGVSLPLSPLVTYVWMLFVVFWISILTSMCTIALVSRGWAYLYSLSHSSWLLRRFCYCLWRWNCQYRRLHYDTVHRIWAGTLLLNATFALAGSTVSWSAKLYSTGFRDFAFHKVGAMVIVSERSYMLGHVLRNGQLPFGLSSCDDYSCVHPHALLFGGGHLNSYAQLYSNIPLASTLEPSSSSSSSSSTPITL
jgi:hypothetical protein